MSTPDKTNETMDLAAALNSNSADAVPSSSSAEKTFAPKKSKDDELNANMTDLAKRFNDIDLSFRNMVVTQESSTELMENFPDPITLLKNKPSGSGLTKRAETTGEGSSSEQPGPATDLLLLKPKPGKDDQQDDEVDSVYERLLQYQREGNPYLPGYSRDMVENIQVLPEVVNCPKCARKVAAGAINHHVKHCNQEPLTKR